MRPMRKALSFSNVMSVLAVFIALGGTAIAVSVRRNSVGSPQLKQGSVRSGDIGNRQVSPIDTSRALGFQCPAGTQYVGGVCIELASRTAGSQRIAEERCFGIGRRLPTVAELQLVRFSPGVSVAGGGEWTSAYVTYRDFNALWGVLVLPDEPYTSLAPRFDSAFPFRCVARPRG
jgi:hypothetical protein